MNDLQAIKWIMAQPDIWLSKIGDSVKLHCRGYTVEDNTMIKCVIKMKKLINA